ncbi:MAG TPA: ATP-binding protein [Bacteroidales bacterium]|nr:ATP-binding protein [Bacteroidales bacterium]
MISRKLYLSIVVYVLAIFLLCLALAFLISEKQSLRLMILCAAALVFITANLVSYLNRTNKSIRYFFDSVKNEESGLSFNASDGDRSLRELYQSMNNVNHQIQQLRIRNNQQEQYFKKILEHVAIGIITFDNRGFIQNANTSAKELLMTETLTHIRQLEKVDMKLHNVISSMKPNERKLVGISTKKGDIQLALKSTSYGSDEKRLTILSVQDIRHELDEKEIDSWMKLIRVLMHEIMNSITPITSLSESLSDIYRVEGKPLDPVLVTGNTISTTLKGLEVIRDQSKGLMTFVENYRKLTHVPRPEKKKISVPDIFSRVRILAGTIEKGKNTVLIFEPGNSDLVIYADEDLVSLVLINLIKNAIEANCENEAAVIKIYCRPGPEQHTEICVSDNGPGIIAENIGKIFIPFFTTRKNGSGIGLSLSRQIMGAHGGTLTVRSEPGKETVFCMSFINFAG